MSVSNLSSNASNIIGAVVCVANNANVQTMPLPKNNGNVPGVPTSAVVLGTKTGANGLVLGTTQAVQAYNAVTPAGLSLNVDGSALLFKGGADDTSTYAFLLLH